VRLAAYAVVYTTLASLGLVMLRRSLADSSAAEIGRTPGFYVGGLLYAASFGTFLAALRHFEALTVFPLFTGITYVTVTLAAVVILGESLTAARLGGIALVGAGAVLLVR
jgi:multidrug transporter EmrE-like cation transporter